MNPLSVPGMAVLLATLAAAQQGATWLETTPAGIFLREATSTGAGPAANPNPSPLGLRWTYPNPPGLPWISEFVSVGNGGTFAWLGQNLNGQRLSLLSATDAVTPTGGRWETLTPGATRLIVRAADQGATAVVGLVTSGSGPHEIRYYKGTSSTHLWSALIAGNPVGSPLVPSISDDGRFVAVGYTNSADLCEIQVFDANANPPTAPVRTITSTFKGPRQVRISADGTTILEGSHQANVLYDRATGGVITTDQSTVSHDAHAVDATGVTFGRGGFDVGAWKKVGSTWSRVLTFNDPTLSFGVYLACDLSADGNTFAVAATDATNNYLPFRVYCWRLSLTGATLLWTFQAAGQGQFQDTPSALAVSDDGKYIAVGSWGDQFSTHPEVMLFDRDSGNVPIGKIDTPGSVFDLDLSGDGQFLVAGTKAVHANTFGNGGAGYCLDRGGQGQRLFGAPAPGNALRLETGGNPGEVVLLVLGSGRRPPLTIPGFSGALEIDLALPFVATAVGNVPASGVHTLTLTTPSSASVIGQTLWSQTARLGSGNAFENVIRLAFTP